MNKKASKSMASTSDTSSDAGHIKDLRPDPQNANKGTPRGGAQIERSLSTYGAGRSILVDKNGVVIAGNATLEAAASIGLDDTLVVRTDGTKLVVVQRTDLDLLTDAQAKELSIADNRASEVGLSWDATALLELQGQGLTLEELFTDQELEKILSSGDEADDKSGDEIPEMAIRPFEHHDYIMVVFRDSHAWTKACDLLGIQRESTMLGGRRKIGLGRVVPGDRLFQALGVKPEQAE